MKKLFLACTAMLVLSACKPLVDTMTEDTNEAMEQDVQNEEMQKEDVSGGYQMYQDGDLTNGETKVLFFHAAWCPVCKDADEELRTWYEAEQIPLPTYRLDYDTETALKQKYGVTTQHTFVLVDGSGEAITTLYGPSSAELKRLLYRNMEKAKEA